VLRGERGGLEDQNYVSYLHPPFLFYLHTPQTEWLNDFEAELTHIINSGCTQDRS